MSDAYDYPVCPTCGEMTGPIAVLGTDELRCEDRWHWREARRRGVAEQLGGWWE